MARNIFDTIEMCDKHFGEKTFENVQQTFSNKNDIENVVDVDVDSVNEDENAVDNIENNNTNEEEINNEC